MGFRCPPRRGRPRLRVYLGVLPLVLAGCVRYQPAPLSPSASAAALEARSLADPRLKEFVEANLRARLPQWPPASWTFEQLTLAAFYFHPDLDVARAQWTVARSGEITAGARPNPTARLGPQFNANAAPGLTPWLALADVDVPIETAGKRGHRAARAKHLSQAARLNIIAAAWQVRSRLCAALLDFGAAGRRAELLRRQIALQEQVLQRLEQKRAAGAIAGSDTMPLRIALQKARLEAAQADRQRAEARARVAEALALPLAALDGVALPEEVPDLPLAAGRLTSAEARRAALTHRADLLSALAEYEASQAALQLEVAKQYPDLKLGPGYEYDQGEHKIGFALGAELPVFHRNQGPIAEAIARRAEAAARFTALQTRILSEIDSALAAVGAAEQQLSVADSLLAAQRAQRDALQRQFDAGAAEPLDLLQVELELAAGELARHDAQVRRQQAWAQIEQAIQQPLNVDVTASARSLPITPHTR